MGGKPIFELQGQSLAFVALLSMAACIDANPLAAPPTSDTDDTYPSVTPDAACAVSVPGATSTSLVLFGGTDQYADVLDDLWTFDGGEWAHPCVTGPSARTSPSIAMLGKQIVLFGGQNGEVVLGDTWAWNGSSWTEVSTTGPSARSDAALASLGNELVLFGGYDGTEPLGDTWSWNGASWTKVSTTGPSARLDASMASLGSTIVLFGGGGVTATASGGFLSDTWTWNGTAWHEEAAAGPSARDAAFVASLGTKVVLFGGWDGTGAALGDLWTWNGGSWAISTTATPPARYGAAGGTVGSAVVLFGGEGDDGDLADTWTWNGTRWTEETAEGPSAREGAGASGW